MAHCNVCGDETGTQYSFSRRQTLCPSCLKDTPKKRARSVFDREYWGTELPNIPESTRREFYADYKASNFNLKDYIHATDAHAFATGCACRPIDL